MLEQVGAQPRTKCRPAMFYRDGKLRLCQRRLDMCRHVVRPFCAVTVHSFFRRDAAEELQDVCAYIRISVLLYQERCRGVAAPDRKQAATDGCAATQRSIGSVISTNSWPFVMTLR